MSIPREKIQMDRLPTMPGEMLLQEFMLPNEMSARALARDLGVPPNRITGIINGKRAMTAETAVCWRSVWEVWLMASGSCWRTAPDLNSRASSHEAHSPPHRARVSTSLVVALCTGCAARAGYCRRRGIPTDVSARDG